MKHKSMIIILAVLAVVAALCSCSQDPTTTNNTNNNGPVQRHVVNEELSVPRGSWLYAKENEAVYELEINDNLRDVVLRVAYYDSVHEEWPDNPIKYTGILTRTEHTRVDKNTPELLEETRFYVYELDFTTVENDNGMGENIWDGAFEINPGENCYSWLTTSTGGTMTDIRNNSTFALQVSASSNMNACGLVAIPEWKSLKNATVFNQWWKTPESELGFWD